MLNSNLIHPDVNRIIAASGHHSRILIADGGYPCLNKKGPNAEIVHLNFAPGLVGSADVLKILLEAVVIDAVYTMDYEREGKYARTEDPEIWHDYRRILADDKDSNLELQLIEKWKFYDEVMTPDHVLTIQTGEIQGFANLILDLGCRRKFD